MLNNRGIKTRNEQEAKPKEPLLQTWNTTGFAIKLLFVVVIVAIQLYILGNKTSIKRTMTHKELWGESKISLGCRIKINSKTKVSQDHVACILQQVWQYNYTNQKYNKPNIPYSETWLLKPLETQRPEKERRSKRSDIPSLLFVNKQGLS